MSATPPAVLPSSAQRVQQALAAAGTPHAVVALTAQQLLAATRAQVLALGVQS
ncbi:MAG: hypothetical protein WD775_04825 [Burkholderiales bacterium]